MFLSPAPASRTRLRRGASSLEIIVAFTLLTGALTVSTSLIVKHGRMLQSQRHYRIALDELSNHIEQLSVLPEAELDRAVAGLQPSEFAAEHLPGAQLDGQLEPGDLGRRLLIRIWWDEPERRKAPVELVAWLYPARPRSATAENEGDRS